MSDEKVSAMSPGETAAAAVLDRLRESELLIGAFGIACVATDRGGTILHWSPQAARLFDLPAEQAVGHTVTALGIVDPDLADSIEQGLREDAGAPLEADVYLRRPGGARFPARLRVVAGHDPAGKLDGAFALITDLSSESGRSALSAASRSAAIAELSRISVADLERESFLGAVVERLTELLDLDLAALITVDPGGDGILIEAGFGWDQGVVGAGPSRDPDLKALLPGADPVLTLEHRPPPSGPEGLLDAHGVRAVVSVAVGAPPSVGALVGLSKSPRDFGSLEVELMQSIALVVETAEIRRRSRELEQRFDRVSRMEAMGQLTGGIAHDFNNLLGVILNFAAFAREDAEPGSGGDPAESLAEIEVAAKRAAELTHQLLVFSRQEVVEADAIDVGAAVTAARDAVERTLGAGIELVIELEPGLPSVEVAHGQIEEILVNLAANARDAMADGGRMRIEVARGGGRGAGWLRLAVTDTGPGMERRVIERAFEPFFTTKEVGEGSGLGLATVYGLVNAIGGSIELRSEPGSGTTVDILLPAAHVEASSAADEAGWPAEEAPIESAPIESAPRAAAVAVPAEGARVLLVEDDEMVRRLAVRVLESRGYETTTASHGREALELIVAGGEFDVVLSDVVMPEMSGPELVEQARSRDPDLRVVLMSGYSGEALPPESVRGATLVEKPFTPDTLLRAVEVALAAG